MADVEKIRIVVQAEDDASAVLSNVESKLSSLSSGIGKINSALRQYNSSMSSLNRMMTNTVKDIGSAIYDFTSDSIDNFSALSEQHAKTLGAMANDYDKTIKSQEKFIEHSEKLKQQAIDLAKYGVNGTGSLVDPTSISSLQTELVKAGVSAEVMLSTNVVKDVLQFAQANQLDNATAVEFAVSLGSQFGIDYTQWGDMLDKVSHTADMSIIDVQDIVASMKYAGGITSGLDRPMEEVLGMISVLGNFGLRGSQAGSGIQALVTRLLTGDTTVITDAMAEVAPEKALKAFYDFSNYAKSGGSEITYDDILNETFTDTDITGELRPMEDVLDAMETVMADLNDEEQAWFAKKLFGLYQMKSAYALINGDDSSDMALQDVIKEIEENSLGTNANKLTKLLESQDGQFKATTNLIESIKTELGQMLEPTTLAVLGEVQNYLRDPGNYDINWSRIQGALDESCDAIEDAYGTAIADAVRNLGGLAIDLGQVVEEIAPEFVSGMLDVLNSLISLNFTGGDGVGGKWGDMIDDMNASLEDLPPNLRELGEKVIDVVDAFGKLAALNIATTIAQLVSSVLQIALMTVHAGSVIVNGGSGGGTGTIVSGGSGGGTTTNGGNTAGSKVYNVGSNAFAIGGSIVGGKLGSEIGDSVGDSASEIVTKFGADEDTADAVDGVTTGIFTIGGSIFGVKGAQKLWELAAKGAGTLGSKYQWAKLFAAESGGNVLNVLGGGSKFSSGVMGTGVTMLIADELSNVIDMARGDIPDNSPYSYLKRIDPNVLAGLVAGDYEIDNGGSKWFAPDDKIVDKDGNIIAKDEWFSLFGGNTRINDYERTIQLLNELESGEVIHLGLMSESTGESKVINGLYELINNMSADAQKTTVVNPSEIPGWNIMTDEGRYNAINSLLNNQFSLLPSITMEAPQIQVDITIDKDGNITSQNQSILNPSFNKQINNWYQKSSSQMGATTK